MRQIHLPMPIWDLPIRLFHWLLVLLIGFLWLSAEKGWVEYHMYAGYAVLSLVLFRIVWGFIGSDTARFLFFLKSPIKVVRHLSHLTKREPDTEIGHNAAGGWMVPGLLVMLLAQIITGMAANDDISVEGPLARLVGKDWSDWMTGKHHLLFKLIQIVVALHVLAIITYAVLKGHNLVRPMITGKKRMPGALQAPRMMPTLFGLAVWAVMAIAVFVFVRIMS